MSTKYRKIKFLNKMKKYNNNQKLLIIYNKNKSFFPKILKKLVNKKN